MHVVFQNKKNKGRDIPAEKNISQSILEWLENMYKTAMWIWCIAIGDKKAPKTQNVANEMVDRVVGKISDLAWQ